MRAALKCFSGRPSAETRSLAARGVTAVRMLAVVSLSIAIVSAATDGQDASGRRDRWWQNAEAQRGLRLTRAQVHALDGIFEQKIGERIALRHRIDVLDRQLRDVIERGEADDATVMRLSGQVEALRTQSNIRRALMLLAMYKILTPEQRVRFSEIQRAQSSSP